MIFKRSCLFYRTFIIEKQPPQVLKIQTKFGVAVRYGNDNYIKINKITKHKPICMS